MNTPIEALLNNHCWLLCSLVHHIIHTSHSMDLIQSRNTIAQTSPEDKLP